MRLTDEMVELDDRKYRDRNVLAELKYMGREIKHRKTVTNDDIRFYAWLCRSAYTLLKEQDSCENCAIAIEDRQPVVRCRDCKHWEPERDGHCPYNHIFTVPDWFCADAERKDNDA